MRSNKLLFLCFLALYFIAGLSLLIAGSVAHQQALQLSTITGYSLVSSAGFIIALGVIILILTAVGFLGAYKNRLSLLKIFIGSLILILLLQLIASIVAFTLRNKAEDQLRTKLIKTLPEYKTNPSVKKEWDRLQQKWKCCGVTNSTDWINHGGIDIDLPTSCCANNDCTQSSPSTKYTAGCYQSALNLFFRYSKTLGVITLFFFIIEIAGLVLSVQLLRELKNNYGSV
ncbi:unnamed protein product [Adineta ricciae]|uniref:Tetraspanin n=1 Tax=Adineta ricciae TaxID=249248 RepID=A0A814TAR2_ADIRI|nr:unnamed protein product [Adineta ricciae]CAF1599709.1 unnamed protein product [Adineta ricciae]